MLLRAPPQVSAIDPKWLVELAPRYFRQADAHKLSRRKRGAPPHAVIAWTPVPKPRALCSCSMQETGVPVLGSLFSTLTAWRCALQASGLSRCTTGTTTPWPGGCRAAGVSCAVARVAPAAGNWHAALWHCIGPFAAVFHRLLRCWRRLCRHSCTGVDGCCTLLRLVGSTA